MSVENTHSFIHLLQRRSSEWITSAIEILHVYKTGTIPILPSPYGRLTLVLKVA